MRDRAAVTEAITRLWHNGQFSTSSVVVGIAGLRAITRELDLPYVPDDEVDSAVRFQSEEVIPFPPEQTVLSAQVLTDFTSPEGGKMRRVLVAAAHTDLVSGVISVVESAGLQVRGVDLVSSALVRAVSSGDGTDQPEAIVSIGAGLTVVAIHQQGRPQFVRTIGQGGNAVTAAISGSLDLPMADAEGLKRRLGEATPQVQAAAQAAQETMANLVGEVRNSIQYYASLPGRMPVARVLVTGGGSYLAGLLPLLESQVHLPVVPVSPLSRLDTSKLPLSAEQAAQVSAVLSTPIGLALPETNPAVKKFNLLPPEVAKRVRMKQLEQRVMVGSGVVVLALLAFGGWKFVQVHNAQNNVDNIQTSISSLNAQIPKYDLVVAADNAYNEGKARRATVLNSAVDWPAVLSGLIAITPPGAQVDSFNGTSTSATSGTGSTSATTAAGTPPASAAIGSVQLNVTGPGPNLAISQAWITKVGQSPLFANPVQGATTTTSSGQVAFPFSLSVTPTAGLAKNASVR